MSVKIERPSFPHLTRHDCYCGYYLPCEFERLIRVEPFLIFDHWPVNRAVGSSPQLLRELETIQATLRVPDGYDWSADDPLFAVKAGFLQLRTAAQASCRHGLPIVFWG